MTNEIINMHKWNGTRKAKAKFASGLIPALTANITLSNDPELWMKSAIEDVCKHQSINVGASPALVFALMDQFEELSNRVERLIQQHTVYHAEKNNG